MKRLEIPVIDFKKTLPEHKVSSDLRICVDCGYAQPEKLEFGISCEVCGALFIFSEQEKNPKREVISNGKNL